MATVRQVEAHHTVVRVEQRGVDLQQQTSATVNTRVSPRQRSTPTCTWGKSTYMRAAVAALSEFRTNRLAKRQANHRADTTHQPRASLQAFHVCMERAWHSRRHSRA
eukprot:358331-Chlamydomonas_euryale.AAC.5